jgi:Trm5-related predicted tRNA methylase
MEKSRVGTIPIQYRGAKVVLPRINGIVEIHLKTSTSNSTHTSIKESSHEQIGIARVRHKQSGVTRPRNKQSYLTRSR